MSPSVKPTLVPLPAAPAESNRRQSRRIKVTGVAALAPPGGPLSVWVLHNLSMGGASIASDARLIPGQRLRLQVHLAGPELVECVELPARVLRRQIAAASGARCALQFDALSTDETAALTALIEDQQRPTLMGDGVRALVVTTAGDGMSGLVRQLAVLGQTARVVRSPLDAAAWLQRDRGVTTILVEETLIGSDGFSLVRFVREEHAGCRCIAVAGDAPSFRLDMAVRAGLVDTVIGRPFRAADLARKLGLAEVEAPRRARRASR